MIKIVFATHNEHKLKEIRAMVPPFIDLVGLEQFGIDEEIPETSGTIEGNAVLKARFVYDRLGLNCFADDTGLETKALDGMPGVHSAKYAGADRDSNANIDKLLSQLNNQPDRRARFRTVICLIFNGIETTFEGVVNGAIALKKSGTSGFGYDPVFIPDGYTKTFAQMLPDQKNAISHRYRAIEKLIKYLQLQKI